MNNLTVTNPNGMSKLVRAKFGPGMLLEHEDLELLNSYTRDLSRLMFRSLFGCGVVCGLVVECEENCGTLRITVGAGLALDGKGDPVHLPNTHGLSVGGEGEKNPELLWVALRGTTRCCAPRTAMCASDDEPTSANTKERDGYEILVLSKRPECVCGCPEPKKDERPPKVTECKCVDPEMKCYQDHYAGTCGCNCDECSDCDCKCILLARLERVDNKEHPWRVDHRVRRFIRPVLMRDPQEIEQMALPGPRDVPPETAEMNDLKEQLSEALKKNGDLKEQLDKYAAQEKHPEQPLKVTPQKPSKKVVKK